MATAAERLTLATLDLNDEAKHVISTFLLMSPVLAFADVLTDEEIAEIGADLFQNPQPCPVEWTTGGPLPSLVYALHHLVNQPPADTLRAVEWVRECAATLTATRPAAAEALPACWQDIAGRTFRSDMGDAYDAVSAWLAAASNIIGTH